MAEIPSDLISEQALAAKWGFAVSDLAEFREMYAREGIHYSRPQGLAIYWHPEGVRKASEYFNPTEDEEFQIEVRLDQIEAKYEGWAMPPAPGTALSDTICQVLRICPNPRMLTLVNAAGERFLCKVRSNSKFRKGMLVDLASCSRCWNPSEQRGANRGGTPLYELRIPPPRFYGRWGYRTLAENRGGWRNDVARNVLKDSHAG